MYNLFPGYRIGH